MLLLLIRSINGAITVLPRSGTVSCWGERRGTSLYACVHEALLADLRESRRLGGDRGDDEDEEQRTAVLVLVMYGDSCNSLVCVCV